MKSTTLCEVCGKNKCCGENKCYGHSPDDFTTYWNQQSGEYTQLPRQGYQQLGLEQKTGLPYYITEILERLKRIEKKLDR